MNARFASRMHARTWTLCGALALGAAGVFAAGPVYAQDIEVVGGQVAPDGAYPFQVSVGLARVGKPTLAHFCGGVLISPRDVLTAAHCVNTQTSEIKTAADLLVYVGSQNLKQGGRRVKVTRMTQHPKAKVLNGYYDVAVLRLAEPVTGITPVAYVKNAKAEALIAQPGTLATTVGWGQTMSKPMYPTQLLEVQVPLMDSNACKALPKYDPVDPKSMLCAGYPEGGKDSCGADSGGPLMVPAADGQSMRVIGIVSWGEGCAEPNAPGVYTRVAAMGKWIAAEVAKP